MHKKRILESKMLDELSKFSSVPAKRNQFHKFVEEKSNFNIFPKSIIQAVWKKLKACDRSLKNMETIEISSDDSDSTYEPISKISATLESRNVKTIPLNPKVDNSKKRKKQFVIPTEKKNTESKAADDILLKKFRQKIILGELLKRDKEMLNIQGTKDKLEEAVAIELKYASRIQKDRVEGLAIEMLNQEKTGIKINNDLLESNICLVNPDKFIPSEGVVTESLPSFDSLAQVELDDSPTDYLQYDIIHNGSDFVPLSPDDNTFPSQDKKKTVSSSVNNVHKTKRKSYPLGNSKKRKKKLNAKGKQNLQEIIDTEQLKNDIFLNKLIEIRIPDIIEERNKNLRQRNSI